MKTLQSVLSFVCATLMAGSAGAEITRIVTQGEEADLAADYDSTDLIQGLIATELPGDRGWHSVNTDPLDRLPAFTDGQGDRGTGLTGLLNDFPDSGQPAKLVRYALPVPSEIEEIRVFTGNNGRDGRVFHTYTVQFSSDGAQTFTAPVYVQSHLSGTLNNSGNNQWRTVLSQLTNTTGVLASGVTHIQFHFYAVDNTEGEMRDPFDGANSFTSVDDGLTAAITSPLVWEIDVFGHDSPPRLFAGASGTTVELTWLSHGTNFAVQSASDLSPAGWADLTPQPLFQTAGVTNRTSITAGAVRQFFRLRVQP